MRLALGGAALLALSLAGTATSGSWVWPAYVLVQAAASYLYIITGMSSASAAAIAPAICVAGVHAWSIPFRAMLARLRNVDGLPLPPLWSHGGVALVPIVMSAAAQVWLVTEAAAAAPPGIGARPVKGAARIVTVANLVSLAAFAVASIGSIAVLQLVVERNWFPYSTSPAFGLFWLGHMLALESLLAVAGGLVVRGFASRRNI